MPKANNPGCACCGKVLIWDDGSRAAYSDSLAAYTPGDFLDWTTTKIWLDNNRDLPLRHEAVEGETASKVDFAFGSPDPGVDFYGYGPYQDDGGGCNLPIDASALFDPNTDGVDLDYWTGDINDYSLVIWRRPLSSENLYQQYFEDIGGACEAINVSSCDVTHQYPDTFQAPPSWLEDAVSGRWRGRLVMTIDGLRSVLHINDLLAQMNDDMEIEVEAVAEGNYSTSCTIVFNDTITGAFVEALSDCVRLPVEWVSSKAFAANITEGVDELFSASGGLPENYDITLADENLMTKPTNYWDVCFAITQVESEYGNVPPIADETCVHGSNFDYRQREWTMPAVTEADAITAARSLITKQVPEDDGTTTEVTMEVVLCHSPHVIEPLADPAQGTYISTFWEDEFDGLFHSGTQRDDPVLSSQPPIADYLAAHEQFVKNLLNKSLMT